LRCELDAAFFHLHLLAESNGDWFLSANQMPQDRAQLKASFPTPHYAVAYIMETFPIVKRKDEEKWGEYRLHTDFVIEGEVGRSQCAH